MSEPFDLGLESLRAGLASARHRYSPNEVREIVLTILLGKNYRAITEKATRLEISVFMAWILNLCHRARRAYGNDWLACLQDACSRVRGQPEAKWIRLWLMGLTLKTAQNLSVHVKDYKSYLAHIRAESDATLEHQQNQTSLELRTPGISRSLLSVGDSVWLLQIAGAAVLTLRGSSKSTVGKLLEKAIARACLSALGLQEGTHFRLNLAADTEVDREIDAEVYTRRGSARIDVALIGTGNQEVSEDKLARVGRNGIVLVDKLGAKSKVPANAAAAGVRLILIQNNLPLSELYNYLSPLMPSGVSLAAPPTTEAGLRRLLGRLPDDTFIVPEEQSKASR